jgi:RNA polymerase sigma-70 factor (ECF subfamily)
MNDSAIKGALLAAVPSLRAFAISLAMNRDHADDLVQDTLVSAWANLGRFEPGTNLNAWLFTILRNRFYSTYRKRVREVQDTDGEQAARLSMPPEQHGSLDLQDMQRALVKLRVDQREALLLIAAEGMSYDEAAQVCGVAVGTIKSRVHRARVELARLMSVESADDLGQDGATRAALQSA